MTTRSDGWTFDAERLVLDFHLDGAWRYEIDLERCTTSAAVLDWICQLAGKSEHFVSDAHLGQLVRLLDRVLAPQSTLCGFGKEQGPIDPKIVVPREVKLADALDAIPPRPDGSLDIGAIVRAGSDEA